MEPVTLGLGLMLVTSKLAQKLANRATRVNCYWCKDDITGSAHPTGCCDAKLCKPCKEKWLQAGGGDCVICDCPKP